VLLDDLIGEVLNNYKDGLTGKDRAIGILSHVVAAAATDKQDEFTAYIRAPKSELLDD
jgi:hypothetical protein